MTSKYIVRIYVNKQSDPRRKYATQFNRDDLIGLPEIGDEFRMVDNNQHNKVEFRATVVRKATEIHYNHATGIMFQFLDMFLEYTRDEDFVEKPFSSVIVQGVAA